MSSDMKPSQEHLEKAGGCSADSSEHRPTVPTDQGNNPEFGYVKTDHFTSEVYKIEIGNIPSIAKASYGEYKKLLRNKLKLNPHKIKLIPHIEKIYVTFKSEEEKQKAILTLDKYQYKGRIFYVKNARPKADAMAVKRLGDEENKGSIAEKRAKFADDTGDRIESSPQELLQKSVMKWHDLPYEEQIAKKYEEMKLFLQRCRSKVGKLNLDHEVFVWVMRHRAEMDGMCCPLRSVIPSPVTEKYRNKSEFTAGVSMGGLKTVGYRIGKYRDKTCAVEETTSIDILPDKVQKVATEFQEYLRSSSKSTYDPQSYQGHWRQLTVRSTLDGEIMAIVIVVEKKDQDPEKVCEEMQNLKDYFQAEERKDLVSTLLYQAVPTHRKSSQVIESPKVIFGNGHIVESLLGLKFQISPDAFFQCNTLAAEVLYSNIAKMLHPSYCTGSNDKAEENVDELPLQNNVIVFDVCCGTGTIGLTLASKVKHVVGVEMNSQAVGDAKRNAELNGVTNAEFHCGKAEDIMPGIVKKYSEDASAELVAIVDPPRAGLHDKVIQCMRKCSAIKTIIYVSCNPNSIYKNFTDLCQSPSKRLSGLPFLPYCAQPVDLFPHTPHCELIILFKRITGEKESKATSDLSASCLPGDTKDEDKLTNSSLAYDKADIVMQSSTDVK